MSARQRSNSLPRALGTVVKLRQAIATALFGFAFSAACAPPLAAAQETKDTVLGSVVVTAQRREQAVQTVPISVVAIAGSRLEEDGARGINDALSQVSGVNLVETQPGFTTISIRGATASYATQTGAAPIGFYLDELPFSFVTNAFIPDVGAFDLDRVEILRGPQGARYGASSLNGVVRVLTRDANLHAFEVKGRLRTAATERSERSGGADIALNVPLIADRLGARAVASYANLGGFVSTPTSDDANGSRLGSYRFKINAAASDALSLELGVWGSRIDNDGWSFADDDYTTPFADDQSYRRDYDAYDLTANYDAGAFELQSSTGYIDLRGHGAIEIVLGGALPSNLEDELNARAVSEEVRVTSHFAGPWQISGGGFYRNIDQELEQALFELFPFALNLQDESESFALYGEATRSFQDGRIEVTGGLRYFEDRVRTVEHASLFTGTSGLVPAVTSEFDALTWQAVLAYHPSAGRTLYASAATGFRSGFNQDPLSLAVEPELPPVDADEILTYEVGAKGAVFDGRLAYDSALYYSQWHDTQQLRLTALGTAAIINAAPVSGFGVDASLAWHLDENLALDASVSWNGLEFDKEVLQGTAALFARGSRMNTSPAWTAFAGGEYSWQMTGGGLDAFVTAHARYSSEQVTHDVVSDVSTTKVSNRIIEADVRIGLEQRHWSVALFVDNLTDENGAVAPGSLSYPLPPRLRPRSIGVQVTFNHSSPP